MYPTDFDLAVFADYQMTALSHVRQQSGAPAPSAPVRKALAHTLVSLATWLWHPEPDAPLSPAAA